MNRAAVFSVGCMLAVLPSLASAKVNITVESKDLTGLSGPQTLNVFMTGTDAENEGLFAYDLGFLLNKVGGGTLGNVKFITPFSVKPADTAAFVLGANPADYSVASANPAPSDNTFLLNVVNNGNLVDVPTAAPGAPGTLAGTLLLNVDPASVGTYTISIDPNTTAVASGDFARPSQDIEWTSTPGTITVIGVPEPTSLSLLAIGGLLALRRRRAA